MLVPLALYSLYFSYNLEYFYVRGGAVYDAGWFAWLSVHATNWAMPNPPLIGGDFLGTHVFPIFYLTSAIARILPAMPYAVWFCLWLSLWLPLLWVAVYLLLGSTARLPNPRRASLSLLLTLNGLALSMLGFPHIESFIPPLLVLALVGLTQPGASGQAAGILAFLFALSIREDAGMHGALAFTAMALLLGLRAGASRRLLVMSGLGITYGILAIVVQHVVVRAGGNQLQGTYLGNPLFSQVTSKMLVHRLAYWATARSYIFVPLGLMAFMALRRRDPGLALGILIALPWLALSLIAASPLAGGLWGYYCFPLVLSFLWPLILARLAVADPAAQQHLLTLQIRMGLLSLTCFLALGILPGIGHGGSYDRAPWRHLMPPSAARIRTTQAALRQIEATPAFRQMIVDDGVASLSMGRTLPGQFTLGLKQPGLAVATASAFLRFDTPMPYDAAAEDRLARQFPACRKLPETVLELCLRR
ncbi:hypothetical protein [Acidiphilium multivorum]|uniref:hypothetical protein n=1 Tax=Acidiphilium multivorum TaxID=62140 RepID=UPI001B8BCD15|nr:hypothetical protein [Acidiphilium multivorum]MBS3022816.1 hypothetical protein [Acidiphilium multivorum]